MCRAILKNGDAIRMSNWPDSIVSYIDLIGIRAQVDSGTTRASNTMRRMHQCVADATRKMQRHNYVYLLNDCVLLMAPVDTGEDYRLVMSELSDLKGCVK